MFPLPTPFPLGIKVSVVPYGKLEPDAVFTLVIVYLFSPEERFESSSIKGCPTK